jgi:hypothetical protein
MHQILIPGRLWIAVIRDKRGTQITVEPLGMWKLSEQSCLNWKTKHFSLSETKMLGNEYLEKTRTPRAFIVAKLMEYNGEQPHKFRGVHTYQQGIISCLTLRVFAHIINNKLMEGGLGNFETNKPSLLFLDCLGNTTHNRHVRGCRCPQTFYIRFSRILLVVLKTQVSTQERSVIIVKKYRDRGRQHDNFPLAIESILIM